MKTNGLIVFFVIGILGLLSCSDEWTDYTGSEKFAPLVGLCLECRHDMVAEPSSQGEFRLVPSTDPPTADETRRGYWMVPKGARVTIDKVRYLRSFDGHYLFIGGTLLGANGAAVKMSVNDVIERKWREEARNAIKNGGSVFLDLRRLPILWEHMKPCSSEN